MVALVDGSLEAHGDFAVAVAGWVDAAVAVVAIAVVAPVFAGVVSCVAVAVVDALTWEWTPTSQRKVLVLHLQMQWHLIAALLGQKKLLSHSHQCQLHQAQKMSLNAWV